MAASFLARGVLVLCAGLVGAACSDDSTTGGSGGVGGSGGAGGSGAGQSNGGENAGGANTGGDNTGATSQEGGGGQAAGGGPTGGSNPGSCEGLTFGPGDQDLTLEFGGDTREYRVHAPPGYDPTVGTPLVLMLHGYLETNDQIETITEMTPAADERGYLVVYPQGRSTSWNAGTCCGSSSSLMVDDVGFIEAMLDAIEAAYCVDTRRVFSAGFSNGGMLSHRLACEVSDRIAAIGPTSGTMAIPTCTPTRAVPVMHFHGTSDFVVPFDGGGLGNAQSVPDTIAGWVTRNGCNATPTITFDEGDASCETYAECTDGADVTLCTLEGGGHQWPGGQSAGPGGTINMDIEASTALLDFFDAHPLP